MDETRRRFLQVAGLSVLGLTLRPGSVALAMNDYPEGALVTPGPKQLTAKRWAMVIDQKKCATAKPGCVDCIAACHKVHNVPDFAGNQKEEVKWIWNTGYENAFPGDENHFTEEYLKHQFKGQNKPVVVLCNHCDNPPCVRVCPVKATFKRADGIVMMDYHRCIGCRFCMAACPYGARSLNWRDPRLAPNLSNPANLAKDYPTRMRGVVEKCNFCFERLAKGLKPACVEACKDKAIIFGDAGDHNSEVSKILTSNATFRRKPQLGTKPQVYYIL